MTDTHSLRVLARGLKLSSLTLAFALAACGGGGGGGGTPPDTTKPTASINQSGPTLAKSATIVVTFSEEMNKSSLHLGGALAAASDGGTWSSGANKLTLKPSNTWPRGAGMDLSIDAKDKAGNALDTLTATFLIKLEFSNFDPAIVEIGQADFTGMSSNRGGSADANTLSGPYGNAAVSDTDVLFIGDYSNNRVMAYNGLPTANNADADFVLGQPDFTTTTANTTQDGMDGPQQVSIANGKMVVADYSNGRVLIYNTVPTDASALPDLVVGQPDFTTAGSTCDADHMSSTETAELSADGKLVVTDSDHNRVLIWNSLPTTSGQQPDLVLGQADYTHCTDNDDNQDGSADTTPSARTLSYPAGIWTDGDRLVVVDDGNNRVLIWNSFPTSDFQPADLVLGQGDFTHNTANDDNQDGSGDGVATARTMDQPYDGVDSNGVQLAIADDNNHRVLIWNSFPTSSFQPADVVLGQSNFVHHTHNDDNQDDAADGAATARVMYYPAGVRFYQDKLLVNDLDNNRVLIFQSQ